MRLGTPKQQCRARPGRQRGNRGCVAGGGSERFGVVICMAAGVALSAPAARFPSLFRWARSGRFQDDEHVGSPGVGRTRPRAGCATGEARPRCAAAIPGQPGFHVNVGDGFLLRTPIRVVAPDTLPTTESRGEARPQLRGDLHRHPGEVAGPGPELSCRHRTSQKSTGWVEDPLTYRGQAALVDLREFSPPAPRTNLFGAVTRIPPLPGAGRPLRYRHQRVLLDQHADHHHLSDAEGAGQMFGVDLGCWPTRRAARTVGRLEQHFFGAKPS